MDLLLSCFAPGTLELGLGPTVEAEPVKFNSFNLTQKGKSPYRILKVRVRCISSYKMANNPRRRLEPGG